MIRDNISNWIASHGFTVTDDGEHFHILIPASDGSAETISVTNYCEARKALGY